METVLGRYRNLIILVGVLFLQVLGLAVQVKRSNDMEKTRLIRLWAVEAITPFERCLIWLQNGTGGMWHNYVYLRGVRAENRQLKEQIEQMRLQQVRLNEDAAQARRLQSLLAFKEQFISRTVAAQVIGTGGTDLSRIVYIDKGSDAGVSQDMAVITADGIVGKVWEAFPSVAKVLLINDQTSGVGAILEKTRLQGVLRGTPNGEVMLERVMSDEEVVAGETVLTSGGDQIFPKGLPVGKVASAGGKEKETFLTIKVKPAANLSRLEEVLVVLQKQERQPVAQDKARARAADILAERLPSVPETPVPSPGAGLPPQAAGSVKPQIGAATPAASVTSSTTNASSTAKPQASSPSIQEVKNPPVKNPAVKNPAGANAGEIPSNAQPPLPGAQKSEVPKPAPKPAQKKVQPNGTATKPATGPATANPAQSTANSQTEHPKASPQTDPPPAPDDSPH